MKTGRKKQYTCNINYFEKIDTEQKAYWYGFILGDGYITHTHRKDFKVLGISLKEDDWKHLEKFSLAVQSTYPIHHYSVYSGFKKGAKYCRIVINEHKLANDLINLGCVENKSNIAKPPINLDYALRKHFIRGYMDANGSIAINKGKNNCIDTYEIKFAGTDDILIWIMNHLIEENIIPKRYPLQKRKKNQIVSAFDFGGNNLCLKYLDYIYQDATVWLDRKYERYLSLKETIKKREEKKNIRICSYCGTTTATQYLKWHEEGEYKDKVFCSRHLNHLRKFNKIIPDIKNSCEICGDTKKLTRVGCKFPNYHGVTLCKKHYEQICKYGVITNPAKGQHKND